MGTEQPLVRSCEAANQSMREMRETWEMRERESTASLISASGYVTANLRWAHWLTEFFSHICADLKTRKPWAAALGAGSLSPAWEPRLKS